jgi:hypothetical protein
VGVGQLLFSNQIGWSLIGHVLAISTCRTLIPEVSPSLDKMVPSASKDIAPTCPYEDPTSGTEATTEVACRALADQQTVPLEGMEDKIPDLLLWDDLLPVRHLG